MNELMKQDRRVDEIISTVMNLRCRSFNTRCTRQDEYVGCTHLFILAHIDVCLSDAPAAL